MSLSPSIDLEGDFGSSRVTSAPCPKCGAEVSFFFSHIGETLEVCPTFDCELHRPHRPISTGLKLKPHVPGKRRRKTPDFDGE